MSDTAILIPTKNRSEYLIRQISYYSSVNSRSAVYIADASNDLHRRNIENAVDRLRDNLVIHYHHWPGTTPSKTWEKMLDITGERYCSILGDDDLVVPESFDKCAKVLDRSPHYRTAQGAAAIFTVKGRAYGELETVTNYWRRPEATADNGAERVLNFAANYWVPQFSVHRTDELIDDITGVSEIEDRSFVEMFQTFLTICKGQSIFVDCLYLFREQHDERLKSIDESGSGKDYSLGDWIMGSNWNSSYEHRFLSLVF